MNTDSCLLGAIASSVCPAKILEPGCGNGTIALMLAQRFPEAIITAIEKEKKVFENAVLNFSNSPFEVRIKAVCDDIFTYSDYEKYDLICCNPPYFLNHLESSDSVKNSALHDQTMIFGNLAPLAKSLLSDNGRLWLIYPPYESDRFLRISKEQGLFCNSLTKIFNKPGRHFRTIMEFSLNENKRENKQLQLYDNDMNHSEEFSRLMSEFYLVDTQKYKSIEN